jgi:hypothetical protein
MVFTRNLTELTGNLLISSISFLAFLSMFALYKKFPSNFPKEKKGKLFLLLAVAAFFIGDLIWMLQEVILKTKMPIGGTPDLLWNIAYVLLATGLIYFIQTEFRSSYKGAISILLLGIIAGGAYLTWDIAEDIEEGTLAIPHLIQDLYPFYDFIILALVIILVWPLIKSGNKLFQGWIILGVGIITRIIYDMTFIIMSENETYYTGHPIDLLYVMLYLAIIFNNQSKCTLLNGEKK